MPILSAFLLLFAQPWPAAAPPGTATLVVYRAYAEPILFAPTLMIDGNAYGELGQKRLLAFALSPGRHRLEALWPSFAAQRPSELVISVRPGQQVYVELQATAGYLRRKGVAALVEQDPQTGAKTSRCCRPPR